MKHKSKFLKMIALAAVLVMLLAGCGNKGDADVTEPAETADPNIPQHTVAPITDLADPTTSAGTDADNAEPTNITESEPEPVDAITEPESTNAPETTPAVTEDDEDNEEIDEELDTRAIACLKLFNSSKVHAKFIAAESYDGSEIFTTSVEYFINGNERVYITDGMKSIIRDGNVTYVDKDLGIYFTYPDDGNYGIDFGFERSKYKLVSQTNDEEVYEIDGTDITSTWNFRGDGSIRVADRSAKGSFTLYDVEVIESDVSMMDFTIPSSYEEVDAEDYEFYR